MIEFKGSHFEREVILWGVRWYVAYPISYRQLEEMMDERGVEVDHSTLNRWVVKYVPLLEKQFRARKRPVGSSWRLDETYVKVKGAWKYLYRAVDKAGATMRAMTSTGDPADSGTTNLISLLGKVWACEPSIAVRLTPMAAKAGKAIEASTPRISFQCRIEIVIAISRR